MTTTVLNACGTVLTTVPWQRAVVLVVAGEADVFEAVPDRWVHSQHLAVPLPRVVRLLGWVHVPYAGVPTVDGTAGKHAVLQRDKHTCAYCGRRGADTVDHVLPQSRGGRPTWANLVACCRRCNQRKADRTPEEARMPLRWTPWRPDDRRQQLRIWRSAEPVRPPRLSY